MIGPIAGVEIGAPFVNRRELHASEVHRDIRRGICGSGIPDAGAESIVLSGAYEDDHDAGERISTPDRADVIRKRVARSRTKNSSA